MEFDALIKKRHSCRSFSKKPASFKDVMNAIDATTKNPFAGNQNNIKFIIVEHPETITKLSEAAQQSWISETSLVVVVCSKDDSLEKQYGDRGLVYSRQQAGAAIMTLLLKLTDMGLDSCWVGAYADKEVKSLLGVPANVNIEAIIPVGYSQLKLHKARRKISLDRAIFWEQWDKFRRPSAFEDPNINRRDAY